MAIWRPWPWPWPWPWQRPQRRMHKATPNWPQGRSNTRAEASRANNWPHRSWCALPVAAGHRAEPASQVYDVSALERRQTNGDDNCNAYAGGCILWTEAKWREYSVTALAPMPPPAVVSEGEDSRSEEEGRPAPRPGPAPGGGAGTSAAAEERSRSARPSPPGGPRQSREGSSRREEEGPLSGAAERQ